MTVAQVAEKVGGLYIWKDGNGAPGAEERLRRVEKVAEAVKTGDACTAKTALQDIKDDIKKLNTRLFYIMLLLATLIGEKALSMLIK